jgi:glucose-1-phosphate cytidylyltransferase
MVKVVILCGGLGTRLREETEFKPKPLVDIGGMPIIWHIMKIYSFYGYKEFILPLGYKGEMIKEFFVHFNWRANNFSLKMGSKSVELMKDHNNEDWTIHFVDTGLEAGTAQRLFRIKSLLDNEDTFMLTYGDGVADINLTELIEFHKKQGAIATITGINVRSRYGILQTKDTKVLNFIEKPIDKELINSGFMVFNREVWKHLTDENVMLEEAGNGLLPQLAQTGQVSVYHHKGFWACMDTYRDYIKLNEEWKNKAPWKIWNK